MSGRAPVLAIAIAALFLLAGPAAPQVQAQTNEPPLNIQADNVTGTHGETGDEVLLNGNLRMTRGRSVVTADHGRYLRQQGKLFLNGRVKLVDSSATVTCEEAIYTEDADVLELIGNVVVTDQDATLRAPRGRYERARGLAYLEGGVEGRDRRQRLTADRAVYVRDSSIVRARGRGRGFDDENRIELEAEAIDYDRKNHLAIATGSPLMRSREDGGRVTVIRARELRLDTESRVAEAIDSVTVERDTLRGRADFGRFDDRAQRGMLTGNPRVYDDQTTMSGDTLELFSEDRKLRRVAVLGHAAIDYKGARPNTIGETSRLTGRRADIWFARDEIDSLVAVGEARNEYGSPPREGKTAEINIATGDTITVFFRDRKIDRARVDGNARGEYRLAVDVGDTTAAKKEMVDYEARQITFVVPEDKIVLEGGARLSYGELQLRARKVVYDVGNETLVAEGKPELLEKGDRVTGHLMTYDMSSRVGTIYQAETAYEKGLYHGDQIRRVNENELDVKNGEYSTCDLEEPHYHFTARYMKIYLKDKLVAKPVVFYIKRVPLLALPFWIFPIRPGRHSGFLFPQFEFGLNSDAGQFIRNAGYYWAPNDYFDLTFSGDYYQAEPSWVLRTEGVYKLLYRLEGDLRSTFARNERVRRDDYDLFTHHSQELTPRTRFSAQGQFVSSRDYNTSNLYGRSLSQRLNRFLSSSVALSHNADWASITAAADRQQDLDADESIRDPDGSGPLQGPAPGTTASLANLTENTPNLSVSFPTRTLGTVPLLRGTGLDRLLSSTYFSLGSRFQSTRERRAFVAERTYFTVDGRPDSSTRLQQRVTTRRGFATNVSLSDARRLFGFLNIAPRVDANTVVFDFDELGNKIVPAATWSSGVTGSASVYGTFRPRLGRVEGIRHILTPSVSYSFSPAFPGLTFRDSLDRLRQRFNGFGSINISGFEQSFMTFGLDQRVQVKLRKGDQVTRLDNLISLSTRGSLNFRWKEAGAKHPFSPLSWSMFIQPPGLMNASFGWTTDFYEGRPLRNLGYNFGIHLTNNVLQRKTASPELPLGDSNPPVQQEETPRFKSEWTVGLAYSYSGGYPASGNWQSNQTANAVVRLELTENWGFEYSTSANLTERELQTQRFGLSRNLHCWVASFNRVFTPGGETEYYFRLGVRDQRELYYERGTRTGSIGGIN